MVTALKVEPGEYPCVTELNQDYESLAAAVSIGTGTQCSVRRMDLGKGVSILHSWEGLSLSMRGNRRVRRRIIPGVFYVVGIEDDQLRSLTDDELMKYEKRYWNPQFFCEEEMVNSWFDGPWLML